MGENVSTSQAIFCALLSLQTFFCGYFFLLTIFCPANKSLLIKFANFFFASHNVQIIKLDFLFRAKNL